MKLTIKTQSGQKVVDLNSDLQFNTIKGEQYVFSNGFSNYVLNFKDNQESVTLTFNVNGKSIKVELNGIVPHLQANTTNMPNPTAIIINKDLNEKDVDSIVENNSFDGGEIIDRLEALLSKPVELGDNVSSNLTLITNYQTLLESLGAAAAGAGGNATGNGSTFNSIFSLNARSLTDIADTARWENLSESIANIPVDTADTVAGTLTVQDSTDTTTVTVGTATVNEDATTAIVKVTLAGHIFKTGETVTVTLADGTEVEFTQNGSKDATFTFTADSDSIIEADATKDITATVSSDKGIIENPVVNAGTLTVQDSTDTTTVTVGTATVNEDATTAIVKVTLAGHIFKTGETVTVTLADGTEVEFTQNGSKDATFTFTADSDSIIEADATKDITATVSSDKGIIENPVVNAGTLTVQDSTDTTTVTVGTATVNEDATTAIVKVTLAGHIFKTGETVTVTLADGTEVEFTQNGSKDATFTFTADSDSIIEADATKDITATVSSDKGIIENPVVNAGTLTVQDSTDTTTVTVGTATVNEDATTAIVKVTLAGHIFKTGETVTVTLADGTEVEFTQNGSKDATFTFTADSDSIIEADATKDITATVSSDKGIIENPVVNAGTLTVQDSTDTTTVTVGTATVNEDATTAIVKVTLAGHIFKTGETVTVTLADGTEVEFTQNGSKDATFTFTADSDSIIEADATKDITATVSSDKGIIENPVVNAGTLTVQDSTDTTTVTVGTATVNEDATTAIVKVTLAGHIFKTGETVTVTLADGTEVEFTQNGSKDATFTFTADSDSIIEADATKDITATVSSDKGIIENPVVNAGTLTVQDSTDTTTVTVGTATVNEDATTAIVKVTLAGHIFKTGETVTVTLADGTEVEFTQNGSKDATFTFTADSDSIIEADATKDITATVSSDKGIIENPVVNAGTLTVQDSTDTTTVTVGTATVNEDATTAIVKVTLAGHIFKTGETVTVTLADGTEVEFTQNGSKDATFTFTADSDSIIEADATKDITATVSSDKGIIENPVVNAGTLTVQDSTDTTTVTVGTATVNEDATTAIVKVTLAGHIFKTGETVTVTLADGTEVEFTQNGSKDATFTFTADSDSIIEADATKDITATVSSDKGIIENPVVNAGTLTVQDSTDTTTVTVGTATVNEDATTAIVKVTLAGHIFKTGETVTVTLADGTEVEFTQNGSKDATFTFTADSDSIIEADATKDITATVSSDKGIIENPVVNAGTLTVQDSTDTTTVTVGTATVNEDATTAIVKVTLAGHIFKTGETVTVTLADGTEVEFTQNGSKDATFTFTADSDSIIEADATKDITATVSSDKGIIENPVVNAGTLTVQDSTDTTTVTVGTATVNEDATTAIVKVTLAGHIFKTGETVTVTLADGTEVEFTQNGSKDATFTFTADSDSIIEADATKDITATVSSDKGIIENPVVNAGTLTVQDSTDTTTVTVGTATVNEDATTAIVKVTLAGHIFKTGETVTVTLADGTEVEFTQNGSKDATFTFTADSDSIIEADATKDITATVSSDKGIIENPVVNAGTLTVQDSTDTTTVTVGTATVNEDATTAIVKVTLAGHIFKTGETVTVTLADGTEVEFTQNGSKDATFTFTADSDSIIEADATKDITATVSSDKGIIENPVVNAGTLTVQDSTDTTTVTVGTATVNEDATTAIVKVTLAGHIFKTGETVTVTLADGTEVEFTQNGSKDATFTFTADSDSIIEADATKDITATVSSDKGIIENPVVNAGTLTVQDSTDTTTVTVGTATVNEDATTAIVKVTLAGHIFKTGETVTVTLADGTEVEFTQNGSKDATFTFTADSDSIIEADATKDITATVSSDKGIIENPVVNAGTLTVQDSTDTTTVTVGTATVNEDATTAIVKVTLAGHIFKTGETVTVTLADGTEVEFTQNGSKDATFTFTADSDSIIEADATKDITATVSSDKGIIENPVVNAGTLTVQDSTDTTTVTVGTATVNEDATTAIVKVTLAGHIFKTGETVTVTLADGTEVEFTQNGSKDATFTFTADSDSIIEADATKDITATVSSDKGIIENPVVNAGTLTVQDSTDTTTVTVGTATVNEDATTAIVKVTLAGHIFKTGETVTVTLADGTEVEFTQNGSKDATFTFTADSDSIIEADATKDITATVSSDKGIIENPVVNAGTLTVQDSTDTTTVTVGTATVNEDATTAIVKVTLAGHIFKTGETVTVTLADGTEVEFTQNGSKDATFTFTADSDSIIEADATKDITATVSSDKGIIENPVVNAGTLTVQDSTDTTTVTVGTATVNEDATTAIVKVTLAGHIFKTGETVTVTLADGTEVEFTQNGSKDATFTFTADSDSIIEADATKDITATVSSDKGIIENPVVNAGTLTVQDSTDTTTVTVGTATVNEDATTAIVKVTLAGHIFKTGETVTVTLADGTEVEFTQNGSKDATFTFTADSDSIIEADATKDITATVSSDKGIIENPVVNAGTLTVQDSTDTTTVTVGTATVNEDATTAIVKVTLAGHIFKTGETVTVTLADGTEVEFTQNGSKDATFTFTADSDSIIEADATKDITATVSSDKGIIENPVVNAGTLTVQDSTDTTTVTVGTATVNEDATTAIVKVTLAGHIFKTGETVTVTLADGTEVEFTQNGSKDATFTFTADSDSIIEADATKDITATVSSDKGIIENPVVNAGTLTVQDSTDTTTVTVGTATVNEDATTAIVKVTLAGHIFKTGETVTVTLADGTEVEFTQNGSKDATFTFTADSDSIIEADATKDITATVSSDKGIIENPVVNAGTLTVQDSTDTTTVTVGTATVNEDATTAIVKVTLAGHIFKTGETVTVTLADGTEVEFTQNGSKDATFTFTADSDSIIEADATKDITATVSSDKGIIENPVVNAGTLTVQDSTDTTTVTVGTATVNEDATTAIVKVTLAGHIFKTGETVTVTLADGTEVEFTQNGSKDATFTFTADSDSIIEADATKDITATVSSDKGIIENPVVNAGTLTVQDSTDTTTVTVGTATVNEDATTAIVKVTLAGHIFKTGETVTVTLADGTEVEFTQNGSKDATFTFTADSDSIIEADATKDITATVSSDKGIIENPVVNAGTLTVQDSTDTTTVTVGTATVNEDATTAIVKVTLAGHIFKTGETVTVTLADGTEVEFTQNGSKDATFTFTADSDSIIEADATKDITATVSSDKGIIENPVVNAGTLTVQDSTDTTTVTVGTATVNEDATTAIVKVTLAGHIFKTGETVTVTLADGTEVEFTQNGSKDATFTFTADSDSIIEADATKDITATVSSDKGIIENPVVNAGTLTVQDSTDTTTVTVGTATVNEDATTAIVKVTLAGHIFKTGETVTVTLADGTEVEFTQNGSKDATFTFTADSDSIIEADATKDITATVSSDKGIIENPVVNAGTLTVQDSTDTTTVTVGTATVNEDATTAIVKVTLAGHIFKTGETVTVTLADGTEVEFTQNGSKDATFTFTADSDSIIEADATKDITATVSSDKGIIENPVVNAGTLTVQDSTDTTTVTVGTATVNEDATTAIVKVTLAGHIFKTGETVTVTLADGTEVEFTQNGSKDATFTFTADSDSIIEADATKDITATVSSDKGIIENPVVNAGTLTVQDSTDTTTVTVGTATVNEDATTAIVKVTLAGHIFKTGETVTVTLADGTEVEFTQNGSKDATFTFTADSDSIIEADATKDITATVSSDKGIIENPVVNAGTLTVQDSTDTTTVTVGTATVNEDATTAIVKVTLAGHIFKTGETVTVTLADGTEVEFTQNGSKDATFTFTADSDSIIEADATKDITATVSSDKGIIENPVVNAGTLTVQDSTDTTTVTVGTATVNEDATTAIVKVTLAGHIFKTGETVTVTLADGTEVEFTQNGSKDATFTFTADSDSIIEADATKDITATVSSDKGIIENPVVNAGTLTVQDSTDTTTVTVGTATVNEDATTAIVKVTLAGHIFKTGETVTVTLADGTEVEFTQNGSKDATFTFTADSDSIIEADATKDITATVSSDKGIIENPVVNAGTLTVQDSTDTTTVTVGTATVNEDATTAIVKVTLAGHIFKTGETVTVTLADGTEVEFTQNGSKDATFTFTADSDSIIEADATKDITATVSSDKGIIENPVVNAGTLTVQDSTDTTTVTVGTATVNEDATTAIVKVTLAGHIFKTGETVTVTLADGTEVEFTQNGSKDATFTFTADSDSIIEADATKDITATVSSDKGIIENPVVNAGTLTVQDSIPPIITLTGSTVIEVIDGTATGNKVKATVTASIDKAQVEDLIITLDNNEQIIIRAGEISGSIEVETTRIDDAYQQGTTTETVSIKSTSNSKIDVSEKIATITIKDDIDPIDVTITAIATTPKIIDVNTKTDGTNGIKITAIGNDGKLTNLSVIKGTDHDGFGVETLVTTTIGKGKNQVTTTTSVENSNGDTQELGMGEKIVVEFTDADVNSLDVSFAWRNNHETARITFINDGKVVGYAEVKGDGQSTTKAIVTYYNENGEVIKVVNAKGSSDKVDELFTFELPDSNGNLISFDRVEFSSPTNVDDYLINSIVYKEVVNTKIVDVITEGGKVTFNIQTDENYPPQGKVIAVVEINGKTYEVELNATGRGTLTIDPKDLGDLSNVVARIVEIKGGNYEGVNTSGTVFDFVSGTVTPGTAISSDDSIVTNEDTAYILKVTDFGDVSQNTIEFKITKLPENGKLYLIVTKGETIIDKDGNTIIAIEDTKVEITKDQIISLADIGAKKVVFEPTTNSDKDGSFKFSVGDGSGNFSNEYTTTINVIAIADAPELTVNITKTGTSEVTVGSGSNGNSGSGLDIKELKVLTSEKAVADWGNNSQDINCNLKFSGTVDKTFQNFNSGSVTTGSGNDILRFASVNNNKVINTGSGDDKVIFNQTASVALNLGNGNNEADFVGGFKGSLASAEGNDKVIVNQSAEGSINLGEGNNSISIAGVLSGSIATGSGSDTLIVGQNIQNKSSIDLGDGDNTISVGGTFEGNITTGVGVDKIIINGNINGNGNSISTGAGNDFVQINGQVNNVNVNLGLGNDGIRFNPGNFNDFRNSTFDGGKGFDTLYLEGSISNYGVIDKATGKIITWTEYVSLNKNDEGYANKEFHIYKQNTNQAITVKNIEQIVFSDETVGEKEDTVTVYNYDISVNAKLVDIDGSEKLSNATLQNVPEGSKVYGSDGIEIIADENGVYSIKLDENGESKLTLTNEKELSDTELNNIQTSVTSTDTPTDGKEESSQATTFEGEGDIDLTSIIGQYKVNYVDLENGKANDIKLNFDEILADDKEIYIKGDDKDSISLNSDLWKEAEATNVDGVKYNVYTGTNGANSTIKLLIDDDIQVNHDI